MQHLPREVLGHVLSLTVPERPGISYEEWLRRQEILASFALVHSSWTRIAQELLFRTHYLDSCHNYRGVAEAFQTIEVGSYRLKTKYLTVEGDMDKVLAETGTELWKNVKHLVHMGEEGVMLFGIHAVRFRELETLEVYHSTVVFTKFVPLITLAHLRRLVLDHPTTFYGEVAACESFFSPSTLPLLSHLSIGYVCNWPDALGRILDAILPQLQTLALKNHEVYHPQPALHRSLNRLSKDAHLSINQYEDVYKGLNHLFSDAAPLRLASLHLPADTLLADPAVFEGTYDIALGRAKTVVVSRVVLYGPKEEMVRGSNLLNLADCEWRTGPEPPFVDFDGT
ncbi:hypothetical protein JCM16303_004046 [Sporobolomyces ruberrimus]